MNETLLDKLLEPYNNFRINKIKKKCSDDDYRNLSFFILDNSFKFNKLYEKLVENYENFQSEISDEKYDIDTLEYYADIYRQIFYLIFKIFINMYDFNYSSQNLYNGEVSDILRKNKLKNFVDLIVMWTYLQNNITSISFAETRQLFSDMVKGSIGSDKVKMSEYFVTGDNRDFSKDVVKGMMEQPEVKKIFSNNQFN